MEKEPNFLSSQRFESKNQKSDKFLCGLARFIIAFLVIIAGAAFFYFLSQKNSNQANLAASPAITPIASPEISASPTATPEAEKLSEEKISLLSFGDVMLDREARRKIAGGGNPFSEIRGTDGNFFRGMDFISVNLEGPITDNLNCPKGELDFSFDSATTIKFLKENNINLANIGNNHATNCGQNGIRDTAKYLSEANIGYFGNADSRFVVKQVGSAKIAFMGINALAESGQMLEFYDLVKKIKLENDYAVINIHWGNEYDKQPSVFQKDAARKLIDSGADMIIGHHPHVIQPVEIYKNKPIFYSLGNFVFDQILPETKKGLGVGAIFGKEKISLSLFPFEIKNFFQPVLLDYGKTKSFCDEFLKNLPQKGVCRIEIPQQ